MAQYASNSDGENIYDVGDLVDNIDYTSLNSDNPPETGTKIEIRPVVSLTEEDVKILPRDPPKKIDKGIKNDDVPVSRLSLRSNTDNIVLDDYLSVEDAVSELVANCEEAGILMSPQMKSQIVRSCSNDGVTKNDIRWFVKGYGNCLTSHIISSMQENMADMRVEIKRLQSHSVALGSKAEIIQSAANGLATKVQEVKEEVKDRISSSLENIETFVTDTIGSLGKIAEQRYDSLMKEKALRENMIVPVEVNKEDLKGQKVELMEIKVPDKVTPPTAVGINATQTDAKAEDPVSARKTLMSRVGFTAIFCKNLSNDMVMKAIPPSLMSELCKTSLTPKVKAVAKQLILKNITEYTASSSNPK
ncbi:TPA_asm: P [Medicago alphacytorhabdovirus 1]|nr:TPA_asm: P [Medicago alphacytorhabdovirus 1]